MAARRPVVRVGGEPRLLAEGDSLQVGKALLDPSGLAAARTFALPDKSGTLALTSDVAGRNRIINGDFRVNQRAYTSGAATTAGQYTFDRWKVTSTGGITYATTNNKTTVTIPSGQTLQQVVEGINLQSGTYVLSWEGTAQGRTAGGSYGASGAVTAAIVGGANATIEFGAGTVTNVQLELGATATPFEYRHFGLELSLCQRYYWQLGGQVNSFYGVGANISNTSAAIYIQYPVRMRSAPTWTYSAASDWYVRNFSNNTSYIVTTNGGFNANADGGAMNLTIGTASLSAGGGASAMPVNSNAFFSFSAEL